MKFAKFANFLVLQNFSLYGMIREERYFTLEIFNSRLSALELGYMEVKDRPSLIAESTITSTGHTLKQAG